MSKLYLVEASKNESMKMEVSVSCFMTTFAPLLLAGCVLVACQKKETDQQQPGAAAVEEPAHEMALVGTYSGTVPCGDCEGIYTSLTLQPDQKYLLIEEYIRERPYPQESEGRWTTREGGEQVMLLKDEGEEVRYFEVIDGKTLRVVLPQEERIENSLDYMLARVDSTDIEMAE
ncbi:copper resistance protein NlpE [Rufibacter quisquiliarum]|uniref:Copper resistance protein NlpE n=1 Tax=Rufibacter quisquiliarum TaxID=1549639 RepID=A0A839GK22_9BACT|nr:hypothetical protein [Rufibacter quisquiliarum]